MKVYIVMRVWLNGEAWTRGMKVFGNIKDAGVYRDERNGNTKHLWDIFVRELG